MLKFNTAGPNLHGYDGDLHDLYLGYERMLVSEFGSDAAITEALRSFNISNSRAPGDWPNSKE